MKVATSRPAYVNFQLATKLFKFQPLGLVNSFSESESFLIFPVFKSVNSSSCYLWDNTRGWFRRGRKRNTVWKYIQWSLDYLNCQNRILVAPAISRKRNFWPKSHHNEHVEGTMSTADPTTIFSLFILCHMP